MNTGRCELCKCRISFEDSQIGMVVECPHCKNKTTLIATDKTQEKAPDPAPPPEKSPEIVIPPPTTSPLRLATKPSPAPGKPRPRESDPTGVGLQICTLIMLIIGVGLTLNGCAHGFNESIQKDGGNAVRQTVYTLQVGFGLVIISLSLVASTVLKVVRHIAYKTGA
jgi:hypothetical protein